MTDFLRCSLFLNLQDGFTLEAGANDDDAYNAVSEICGSLYGESAKCNKHMGNSGDYAVSCSMQFYSKDIL